MLNKVREILVRNEENQNMIYDLKGTKKKNNEDTKIEKGRTLIYNKRGSG